MFDLTKNGNKKRESFFVSIFCQVKHFLSVLSIYFYLVALNSSVNSERPSFKILSASSVKVLVS